MKKLILILLALFLVSPLFAFSLAATADLGTVQDFLLKTYTYQFSADVRFAPHESYELRVPLTVSIAEEAQLYDVGVFLDYYPWKGHGLYVGLSLVQFGFVNGMTFLDKNFYGLNELNIGWKFKLWKGLTVEPSVSVRDPSGTFNDEFELLKGAFPCNRKFRVKLNVGWTFDFNKN